MRTRIDLAELLPRLRSTSKNLRREAAALLRKAEEMEIRAAENDQVIDLLSGHVDATTQPPSTTEPPTAQPEPTETA